MRSSLHRAFQLVLWSGLAVLFAGLQPATHFLLAAPSAPTVSSAILMVNTTEDTFDAACTVESCSLRAAILAANGDPAASTIEFAIPAAGPHTIVVLSRLPALTRQVTIDGTSQPGYAGTPLIILDGSQAQDSGHGLDFASGSDGSRVEGLALLGFRLEGIHIFQGDHITLRHNHIGVYVGGAENGTSLIGNRGSGIGISSGSNNNVLDNIISNNNGNGIVIEGAEARDNVIAGNFIGTNPAGDALGNGRDGILARNSGPQIIGGTYGDVGGCCVGNVIAFNTANGVAVTAGFNASYEKGIRGNRIYANGELGIDLQRDGVTPNDPDDSDGDGLANRLQNFPVLESAHITDSIAITGTLTTRPESDYYVEYFANDACDASGHGQGQRYLGRHRVTTDADGMAALIIVLDEPFDPAHPGNFIAATATDIDGNTSEFSACIQATPATDPEPTGNLIYLPFVLR